MSFYTLLTNIGQAQIANAVALGRTIALTEMSLGDGAGNPTAPTQQQTELVRQVYRAQINQLSVDPDNPAYIIAELVVPTDVGGWTVREVGLHDDDGNLIAVGNFPDTYKPQLSEGAARDLVVRVIIEVSNASVVQLKIDPAVVLASRKWVVDNFVRRTNLAGGTTHQVLRKKSNADLDVEWADPLAAVEVIITSQEETQTLAAEQTIINLVTVATEGCAVYIEGVRLRPDQFVRTSDASLTLAMAYPAGTKVTIVQNEELGNTSIPGRLDDLEDFAGVIADTEDPDGGAGVVGFRRAGIPSAVGRSLRDHLSDCWVSVREFGATGDGVTDDWSAIEAAKATGLPIYFPPGDYAVSNHITIDIDRQAILMDGYLVPHGSHDGYLIWFQGSDVDTGSPIWGDLRTRVVCRSLRMDGRNQSKGAMFRSIDTSHFQDIDIIRTVGGAMRFMQVRECLFSGIQLRYNYSGPGGYVFWMEDDNSLPDITNNCTFIHLNMRYNVGQHIFVGNNEPVSPRLISEVRFLSGHFEMSPVPECDNFGGGDFIKIKNSVRISFVDTQLAIGGNDDYHLAGWTGLSLEESRHCVWRGGLFYVRSDLGAGVKSAGVNMPCIFNPSEFSHSLGGGVPVHDPDGNLALDRHDEALFGNSYVREVISRDAIRLRGMQFVADQEGFVVNGGSKVRMMRTEVIAVPFSGSIPAFSSVDVDMSGTPLADYTDEDVASVSVVAPPSGLVYACITSGGKLQIRVANVTNASISHPNNILMRANVVRMTN